MAAAALLLAPPTSAQTTPVLVPIPAPSMPSALPLGTRSPQAAGAPHETWFLLNGQTTVRNVPEATMTPVLPSRARATGAAVIIAPGGGFVMLSMESEGFQEAPWLADHGVAAFVLKYGLQPTARASEDFSQMLGRLFSGRGAAPSASAQAQAVGDAQAAVRLVRARASAWHIDPKRVGLVGFSAGAITALQVTLAGVPGAAPDFAAPIYGPKTAVAVPADAPPMFAALAADDPLFGNSGYGLVEAWHRSRRPVELHVYAGGGHGFGMGKSRTTTTGWIEQYLAWMKAGGWLSPRS